MHLSLRAAALAGAAALGLVVSGLVATPANAAVIGTVTLATTSGNINDAPFSVSSHSSGPCPTGFGQAASIDVVIDVNGDGVIDPNSDGTTAPQERFSLGPTLNAGGYDLVGAPDYVVVPGLVGSPRTLETRLQGRKGEFGIWITCFNEQFVASADHYETKIIVEGDTWHLKDTGGGGTGITGQQQINTTVAPAPEQLTMTVGDDGKVTLPTPQLAGDRLSSTGQLDPVTVTDNRSAKPGWSTTAQVGNFTAGSDSFSGKYLGWTPSVVSQSTAQGAVAGAAVAPGFSTGDGLSTPKSLASAPAGSGLGSATLGAGLSLEIPTTTPAGAYSATLTLTTI